MNEKPVLVAGAGGALGLEIVRCLRAQGRSVIASYRTDRQGVVGGIEDAGARAMRLDLADETAVRNILAETSAAIFTPILTTSAPAAQLLRPDQPAVFFSSNNVAIDPQAEVYAALRKAEEIAHACAPQAVILRPTMIYGYPGDGNLSKLMGAMRKSPVTPIPGGAKALQQPIYFRDLAAIAVQALGDEALRGGVRVAAGPESLSLRALYREAASAAGARSLLVPVPAGMLAALLALTEKAGLKLPVRAAQLARAGQDKTPQGPVLLGRTPLPEGLRALSHALYAGGGALDEDAAGD